MRTVLYEAAGRIHHSQWNLINYPPEGYEFKVKKSPLELIVGNNFAFDNLRLQVLDRIIPLNYFKAYADSFSRVKQPIYMMYLYNHVTPRKIPWIVHIEWPHILIGRDPKFIPLLKDRVRQYLLSDYCRGITTWTQAAKDATVSMYGVSKEKITVLPPATTKKEIIRNYFRDQTTLLFVGSDYPGDFILKGGMEALYAYLELKTSHMNLRLIIRSHTRVSKRGGNIEVLGRLTPKELDRVFREADILIHPSYQAHNTVIQEAMSYGLPIVTTWTGSSFGEYIKDRETGLVIPNEDYIRGGILLSETIYRASIVPSNKDIEKSSLLASLKKSISYLVENSLERRGLGEAAKAEVDSGRFSIEERNKTLKRLLDEAG